MYSTAAEAPSSHARTTFLLMLAMAATVGGALAFQHLGGYIPCKLCYEQRTPYYIGAPLMLIAFLGSVFRLPTVLVRLLLAVGGLLMVWGLVMGVYHAGVEWSFWAGPTDCGMVTTGPDTGGKGVLDAIDAIKPPSCDRAALRILGISLAGWNAVISLVLAGVAFWGAAKKR